MSLQIAHAAISRMNLREQAVANAYKDGFASDIARMASADANQMREKFENETRDELCSAYGLGRASTDKPYAFSNGFAIIPIHGSLINRFGSSYGYVTGYNFIRSQHMAALMDDDVKYIIHDHNSYGGEAAGMIELSTEIRESRGKKPIIAVVDSNCYSASYALASAADKIITIPSAGVGSIGVVAMHINMKKMLDNFGVEITFIHSGDHKVDGNPYEALSPEVKADIQKSVDKSRGKFVDLVSMNLGLDKKIIYDTEARTYRADDALKLGLIHAVAVPSAVLQSILDDEASDKPDDSQDGQGEQAFQLNSNEESMDPTQGNNTPAAGQPAATVQPQAANSADVKNAERARVKAITTCDAAKGREALAEHFAYDTDMSVDQAQAALAKAPLAAAAPAASTATTSAFETAMNNTAHPNVGADSVAGAAAAAAANGQQQMTSQQKADAVLKDFQAATGHKLLEN